MEPSAQAPAQARCLLSCLALAAVVALSPGCALITTNTWKNEAGAGAAAPPSRASVQLTREDLDQQKLYIGIALSGGGSRAANFSAAVLLELEQMGLLERATVLSSVSGSSLPTAYYGLYGQGRDATKWNAAALKERMRTNFESAWLWRWLLPNNIAQYWFTNMSRSDIMVDVFDSNLFERKTYADMGHGQPRIVLNSTEVSSGSRFPFTEDMFHDQLHSPIGGYPVARAVMASSAFPGAFQDVTLRGYGTDGTAGGFLHLIDGGPSDNLGTTTLIEAAAPLFPGNGRNAAPDAPPPPSCLLVVVDAYPESTGSRFTAQPNARGFIDYFFDTNVANSSDALLSARRVDLLGQVGVTVEEDGSVTKPFIESYRVRLHGRPAFSCAVWYIGLPRLLSQVFRPEGAGAGTPGQAAADLGAIVNSIPTRFTLLGGDADHPLAAQFLQDRLFEAAHRLIEEDRDPSQTGQPRVKDSVCAWLRGKGAALPGCAVKVAQVPGGEPGRP